MAQIQTQFDIARAGQVSVPTVNPARTVSNLKSAYYNGSWWFFDGEYVWSDKMFDVCSPVKFKTKHAF